MTGSIVHTTDKYEKIKQLIEIHRFIEIGESYLNRMKSQQPVKKFARQLFERRKIPLVIAEIVNLKTPQKYESYLLLLPLILSAARLYLETELDKDFRSNKQSEVQGGN